MGLEKELVITYLQKATEEDLIEVK